MTPRIIGVEEAREFFAHPSQQIEGATPDKLPEIGLEYWACGDVCVMFHAAGWPDVFMVHIAVKPSAWGNTVSPARAILRAFWDLESPQRIIGWMPSDNRAVLSLTRRLGFVTDGEMKLTGGRRIVMQGWSD